MALTETFNVMSNGIPFRKYRPNLQTYKGHYKEWWHFAYKCIIESEVRRVRLNWNWNHIKNYRRMCKKYAALYQQKLQTKTV